MVFAAGAIFNIFSAVIFFALAFNLGVRFISTKVGLVFPGEAAWEQGIQPGDEIRSIDGEPIREFHELMVKVAFAFRRRLGFIERAPFSVAGMILGVLIGVLQYSLA